jgi:hypothetical protein
VPRRDGRTPAAVDERLEVVLGQRTTALEEGRLKRIDDGR